MAEYKTEKQSNYGWGLTLEMTGKAPAVAKRIFATLADAQAYADDVNDSAIAGLQLSVISDEDVSKNGVYFVKSIGDGTNAAVLEMIGSGSNEVPEIPSVDLSEYAKTSEVETMLEDYLLKDDLPTYEGTEYTTGDGLSMTDNVIGVQVDPTSDSFLSVSNAGIKVSGIQDAITSSVNDYLNTHLTDTQIVYLSESEWNALKEQVENGDGVWESGVIYMVYND